MSLSEQKKRDIARQSVEFLRLGRGRKITQSRLKEVLEYDPCTGIFTWKKKLSKRISIGGVAGSIRKDNYLEIRIDTVINLAHRLAWLYVYGYFPDCIDHVNLNRSDNRISNLRESTMSQNASNCIIRSSNTSGYKGVSWNKKKKKWRAYITFNKKRIELGHFSDPLQAHQEYCSASKNLHKEFGRTE